MAIMRVMPPPTTVRTGTRCPDAGASDTRGRRSGTPRLQIPQPDQVIGGGGEGELPIHQGDAAMDGVFYSAGDPTSGHVCTCLAKGRVDLGRWTVKYVRALFMTVWRPSTRSAENSCGIRQG